MKLLAECGVNIPSSPASSPTPYTLSVNQTTLRSSISTLIKELQSTRSVDLDKIILSDMEEILTDSAVTLHSMLLPATFNGANQSSVVKTLLRVPFLQVRMDNEIRTHTKDALQQ